MQITKLLATMLFTTKATALMYYGEEIGMATTTPTRREDVKDPIGITGWPKEKGRDGERTPMQWDTSAAGRIQHQPAHLASRSAQLQDDQRRRRGEGSRLAAELVRATHRPSPRLPALRDGGIAMLDPANPNVLSYVRTAPGGSHASSRCAEHVRNPADSLARSLSLLALISKREDGARHSRRSRSSNAHELDSTALRSWIGSVH